ncbi:hypothetical protein [Polaribacter sp. Hel_I_88]|uniref:hypothetical protein n=1 Tax=Polaribacter sp. Hel_I_88 TaxID=1250006 RepID=UPI000A8AF6AA|nr:hypothetical protein [Polaribacter sp. Hel_I_88]
MKKIVFLCFVLFSITVKAQFTESLASDRPGQALSVNTVGKNVFQNQTGIDFFENNSLYVPSSFFRFGLSEKLELNSGFILSGENFASDLASFTIGARYLLSNVDSNSKSSLQLSYDFGADAKNTQLTYIFGSSFTDKLSYTANLGINVNDDFNTNNALYVFNMAYSLNTKMGVFVETFGTFLNNTDQINFDAGYYYLINTNFQLDALIGENDGLFVGAGFTWRVPFNKK